MGYSGPTYKTTEIDKRGDIYAQSGRDFGSAVGKGITSFGDKLKEMADKREQADAVSATWEILKSQHPELLEPFDEKFHSGSLGAKQGFFTQALAAIGRTDQQGQQATQNAQGWARIGLDERRVDHEVEPKMPAMMPDPRSKPDKPLPDVPYNPNTGNILELPAPPPNEEGAAVHGFEGTNYGVGTYNGKPVTGAIPFNGGKPNADGLRLAPVQGTNMAMAVGPDGKPIHGLPAYQKKKATSFSSMISSLLGNPEYEPMAPQAKPAAPGKDVIISGVNGTFLKRANGKTYSMEESGEGKKWVEMQGIPPEATPGDGNVLLPSPGAVAPNKQEAQKQAAKLWR